jgi:hypothetical protein
MRSLHVWAAEGESEERYFRKTDESRYRMLLKGKKPV